MNALADRFNALICTLEPGPAGGLGPLRGVSVMVKDNIDVQGVATTNGLPGVWPLAQLDAAVVTQLRRAGAVIAGKTNLSELALGATSCNRTFGDCRNPRAPDRVPGGSSGGAAAAVAAGFCDLRSAATRAARFATPRRCAASSDCVRRRAAYRRAG